MDLRKKAIRDRYIHIDPKQDQLTYLPQGKKRKLSNPEEQVQLDTYLDLIYDFGYPVEQIRVCQKMKIGSETREADIVIYRDIDCKDPYIIIECKKEKVSERVFSEAIDQGFSYAAVTNAEYVWATSGDRDAVFEVIQQAIMERDSNRLRRIPRYDQKKVRGARVRKIRRKISASPIILETFLFSGILLFFVVALAKIAVEFHPWIYDFTDWLWLDYGMDFKWIYNAINGLSLILMMVFGSVFLRKHPFFRIAATKRRVILFMVFCILLIPAWYMGELNRDPNWWTSLHFDQMKHPSLIYLWPYFKALPIQFLTVLGLVWIMERNWGN